MLEKTLYEINLETFLKAIETFEKFRQDMKTDRDKAGAIQAYEFCFELSWKIIKKILAQKGLQEVRSPRDAFREGAPRILKNGFYSWKKEILLPIHKRYL